MWADVFSLDVLKLRQASCIFYVNMTVGVIDFEGLAKNRLLVVSPFVTE